MTRQTRCLDAVDGLEKATVYINNNLERPVFFTKDAATVSNLKYHRQLLVLHRIREATQGQLPTTLYSTNLQLSINRNFDGSWSWMLYNCNAAHPLIRIKAQGIILNFTSPKTFIGGLKNTVIVSYYRQ